MATLVDSGRTAIADTIRGSTIFTSELLTAAGYTGPYQRPECDPTVETVDWDADALAYVVRPYNTSELAAQWNRVREQRNQLLQSSDWALIQDYDLGADRAVWATYRQALRDLTDAPNPFAIAWPQMPLAVPNPET